jgi:hypothetical protein
MPNNQIMPLLSTSLTQQQMAVSQNGHNYPINHQNAQAIPIVTATSTDQGSVQQSISTYGINVSSEPSNNLLQNPMLAVVSNSHDIIPPQTLSAITHVPSTTSFNRHERDSVPTSTSISTKKETKKENKKASTFAVSKIGMKLKEKAQKKSLSPTSNTLCV